MDSDRPSLISIVVPIRDESGDALGALERLASCARTELVVARAAQGSRGACLARAAERARGDALFFVHADSRPPENAIELIRESLAGGAAAGAFSLAYESADRRLRWVAWWANVRSRLLRLPFGDQGLFCRREAYEAAGGFRDLPVCDDLDLVRRLKRAGPFVVRRERTVTSPRRYLERGPFKQVLLVWRVVIGYYLGISPETLGAWYYGPKPRLPGSRS